jgi:hypothetical protein
MTGNLAIVGDLLHACAHPEVANAALFALKNETIEKVRVAAARRRQSLGAFVAQEVQRFAGHADEADRTRLARRMSAAPTPIAAGLEAILETTPPA